MVSVWFLDGGFLDFKKLSLLKIFLWITRTG
jgi:hypothetical protein